MDERHMYAAPTRLQLNQWALVGDWTVTQKAGALNKPNGRIAYRFHARDVNLIMGPAVRGVSVRYRVLIDGQPPGAAHGVDADDQGNGTVAEHGCISVRQPGRLRIASSRSSFPMRASRRCGFFRLIPTPSNERNGGTTNAECAALRAAAGADLHDGFLFSVRGSRHLRCGFETDASAGSDRCTRRGSSAGSPDGTPPRCTRWRQARSTS